MKRSPISQFSTGSASTEVMLPISKRGRMAAAGRGYPIKERRVRRRAIPRSVRLIAPQKKEFRLVVTGAVLQQGVNFVQDAYLQIPQGIGEGQRIGNEVAVISYHVRVFVRGTPAAADAFFIRMVRYRPRDPNATVTTSTNGFTMTSEVNTNEFKIISDTVGKIGDGGPRQGNGDGIQCMDFGKRYKFPLRVRYSDSLTADPTTAFDCFELTTEATSTQSLFVDCITSIYYYDA